MRQWRSHVNFSGDCLKSTRHLFLAGRGQSLAAAETGGLILKESAHFHAEGMSSAAFRNGPFEMISPEVFVMTFADATPTRKPNRKLATDVRHEGGMAEVVDFNTPHGASRLPQAPESVRTLPETLPVQMVSLALAARKGHEAGRLCARQR